MTPRAGSARRRKQPPSRSISPWAVIRSSLPAVARRMILGVVVGEDRRRRLELDAGRWTDGQAPHGDGHGSDTVVGDVAGLAAVAERAHEQCVVDALVEHGRGVRPADRRDGGQRGDRATLDGPTDHRPDRGGRRWAGLGGGRWWWSCRPASRSSTRRFHGCPSVIVCRSSTTLADAVVRWHHGLVVPDAAHRAGRRRCAAPHHDHRRLLLPVVPPRAVGRHGAADAGLRVVPRRHLGPLRAGRRRRSSRSCRPATSPSSRTAPVTASRPEARPSTR